jgi:hypothetical protein
MKYIIKVLWKDILNSDGQQFNRQIQEKFEDTKRVNQKPQIKG